MSLRCALPTKDALHQHLYLLLSNTVMCQLNIAYVLSVYQLTAACGNCRHNDILPTHNSVIIIACSVFLLKPWSPGQGQRTSYTQEDFNCHDNYDEATYQLVTSVRRPTSIDCYWAINELLIRETYNDKCQAKRYHSLFQGSVD